MDRGEDLGDIYIRGLVGTVNPGYSWFWPEKLGGWLALYSPGRPGEKNKSWSEDSLEEVGLHRLE